MIEGSFGYSLRVRNSTLPFLAAATVLIFALAGLLPGLAHAQAPSTPPRPVIEVIKEAPTPAPQEVIVGAYINDIDLVLLGFFALVMNGQPDCRRQALRPLYPMAAMSWEHEPVAGLQHSIRGLSFYAQARRTCDQQHEFIADLIVPLALRGRLTSGDDTLDTYPRTLGEDIDQLLAVRRSRHRLLQAAGLDRRVRAQRASPDRTSRATCPPA